MYILGDAEGNPILADKQTVNGLTLIKVAGLEKVLQYLSFKREKMDYLLDIIFPKKEIDVVKLNEKLFEWGGRVYSCSPPQYISDSGIVFEQIEDTRYFDKTIGRELTKDAIVLHLKSDILYDLVCAVNNHESKFEENVLHIFLSKLMKLSQFCILMVREDESVKEYYEISTKEEISIRLADCLRWANPKDVILFKKRED